MKNIALQIPNKSLKTRRIFESSLIILALSAALFEGYFSVRCLQLKAKLESELHAIQPIVANIREAEITDDKNSEATRQADQAAYQLIFPWHRMFGLIDEGAELPVAVIGFSADVEKRDLQVNLEAKDMSSMLSYVSRIGQAEFLKKAHLASYQVNTQDPLHPVRFNLSATWQQSDSAFKPREGSKP